MDQSAELQTSGHDPVQGPVGVTQVKGRNGCAVSEWYVQEPVHSTNYMGVADSNWSLGCSIMGQETELKFAEYKCRSQPSRV
eukprot:8509541-Ditylum_brightwellii.AAC.1